MTVTAAQTKALSLVADNPGRVLAVQRVEGWLRINGNTERQLATLGLIAKSGPVAQRTMKVGSDTFTYDLCAWNITPAGIAALGREGAPAERPVRTGALMVIKG